MAIVWGVAQSAYGATVQLGLDFSTATHKTSQTVVAIAYLRCTGGSVSDNYNTLTFYGAVQTSISNVSGTLSAGQSREVGRAEFTVRRAYGAQTPFTVGARIDNYTVGTPSATRSGLAPAIGYSAPERPSFYANRANDSRVNLSWVVTSTQAAPVHGFEIQRREDNGSWRVIMTTADGTMRSWADTGVSQGHVYDYSIQAKGPGGESAWNTRFGVYTTPNPPTAVVASREGQDILITWVNQGVGEYLTHVWDGDTSAGAANLSGPLDPGVSSFTVTGADPSTPHNYTVGHIVPGGLAATALTNTVVLLQAPLAPTLLDPDGTDQPAGSSTVLSWRHNSTDTTAQGRAEIRWRKQAETWATLTATTASQVTLPAGTAGSYEWQVRTTGQDMTKWSPWSSVASFSRVNRPTITITAPASGATVPASSLTVRFTTSPATVSWEATLTAGAYQQTRRGQGSGPHTVTFTSVPSGSRPAVSIRATTTVEGVPVTRSFVVSYAAPAAPKLFADWDEERGAVQLTPTAGLGGAVPTALLRVIRVSSDNSETLVSETSSGVSVTDVLAPLVGAAYVAEAVSSDRVVARSEPFRVPPARLIGHWVNWGPGFTKVLLIRYDPERQITAGRAKTLQEWAGYSKPRTVYHDLTSRKQIISGRLVDPRGRNAHTSLTASEQASLALDDLAITDGLVAIRSVHDQLRVGVIDGDVTIRELIWGGFEITFTHVETLEETSRV